jgi:hypothetical protein
MDKRTHRAILGEENKVASAKEVPTVMRPVGGGEESDPKVHEAQCL